MKAYQSSRRLTSKKASEKILQEIYSRLEHFRDKNSFSGFFYRFFSLYKDRENRNYFMSSYPYSITKLVENSRNNSVVHQSIESSKIVIWSTKDIEYKCQDACRLKKSLLDNKIISGLTIPLQSIHGEVSIISLIMDNESSCTVKSKVNLDLYDEAAIIFDQAKDFSGLNNNTYLSIRQKECIYWCSQGKTSWEISQILNISKQTVDFHLRAVCERCGAVNRPQAVAKSMPIFIWDKFLQSDFIVPS